MLDICPFYEHNMYEKRVYFKHLFCHFQVCAIYYGHACLDTQASSCHAARSKRPASGHFGSTNGTFVNYQRLQGPVRLYDGDIIHFGRREFKIIHELMDPAGFDETTADIYQGDLPKIVPSGAQGYYYGKPALREEF